VVTTGVTYPHSRDLVGSAAAWPAGGGKQLSPPWGARRAADRDGRFPACPATAGSSIASRADGGVTRVDRADRQGVARGAVPGHPADRRARPDPSGDVVAAFHTDSSVRLWDTVTGRAVAAPLSHPGFAAVAAFGPDGRLLATGSSDGRVCVWEVPRGNGLRWPIDPAAEAVALGPDGARAVVVSRAAEGSDFAVRPWSIATGQFGGVSLPHPAPARVLAVSPDGARVLTACSDTESDTRTVRVWDARSGGQCSRRSSTPRPRKPRSSPRAAGDSRSSPGAPWPPGCGTPRPASRSANHSATRPTSRGSGSAATARRWSRCGHRSGRQPRRASGTPRPAAPGARRSRSHIRCSGRCSPGTAPGW